MENQSAIEKLAFQFTVAYGGCYFWYASQIRVFQATVNDFGKLKQQRNKINTICETAKIIIIIKIKKQQQQQQCSGILERCLTRQTAMERETNKIKNTRTNKRKTQKTSKQSGKLKKIV